LTDFSWKTSHRTADRDLSLCERCVAWRRSTASELSGFLVSGWWILNVVRRAKRGVSYWVKVPLL
jgi:hypothetical protein